MSIHVKWYGYSCRGACPNWQRLVAQARKDICNGDTLSLPYTQGTDLSVQVVGQCKPSLPLLRRPLWVVILCMGGHQTWQCRRINLLVLRACVVASGARVIGDLEPQVNVVGNCHTLFRVVCDFLWVAAQVVHTSGWSCEGRTRMWQCRECRQTA